MADVAAAVRRVVEHLHWIRGFCIAHHAQERSGVHLHRLAVDLPQYLDGAIAELEAALGEAPAWQPIETAPKDGREVLCTWVRDMPDGTKRWANVMHVLAWFPHWHGENKGAWVLDGDFNTRFEPDGHHQTPPTGNWDPTHWMPLPDPPVCGLG